jgi:hypothetical protein
MATDTTSDAPAAPAAPSEPRKWLRRIGWLAAIWLASVTALFLLAAAFRLVMGAVGLSR